MSPVKYKLGFYIPEDTILDEYFNLWLECFLN
jgi:hypothetical protein